MDREFTLLGPKRPLPHEENVAVAYPRHRIQLKPTFDLGIRAAH